MLSFRSVVSMFLVGLGVSLSPVAGFGQTVEARLGRSISESSRVTIAGSLAPRIREAEDLGPVAPETVIPGITLVFRRSPAQEAALQELLKAQQDRDSPLFHQWLRPETFAKRFGVADQDIDTTENWLRSHGFQIDSVARSRDRITFSGSAVQVKNTFGAAVRRFRTGSEIHFAPASDLTFPSELAPMIAAVLHLSDFRPKPSYKAKAKGLPDYTTVSTETNYLGPEDVLTMYDAAAVINQTNFGVGQGLAVVGQSYVNMGNSSSLSSFQDYLAQYTPVSAVLVADSGVDAISLGDEAESEIDLEYSSGIAQGANVFLVYVGSNPNYSVFDALTYSITEDIAPVVSISYGGCEPLMSASDLDQFDAVFEEASAQGQTIVASSGDSGSTACAPYSTAEGVSLEQQQELAVNFPASSPNVTAVGGTQMAAGTFNAGNTTYWGTPNVLDDVSSLLSYVPEVAWNEGSTKFGITAGGGGTSIHFARPSWQSALPGMPSGSHRLVPDIALESSIESPGYLLCTSDASFLASEGQTSSCGEGLLGSNDQFTLAGGTSFAAPIFAGFLAILNQAQNATGQGNINPQLYSLASKANTYASVFHDITSGTIACASGDGSCAAPGESGYAAAAGYDEATGLGSIDFSELVGAWPASPTAGLQSTVVLVESPVYSADPGDTVPLQLYVDTLSYGALATSPTGSVSIFVDGTQVEASLPITVTNPQDEQALATYNFVAPAASGSHLIQVRYNGDAAHAPSVSTLSLTVGSLMATGNISLSASNVSVVSNGTGTTEVTVTPSNGYDGRVFWSLAVTSSTTGASLTGCYFIPTLTVDGPSTAKLTLGVGTACNSALPSERRQFRTVVRRAAESGLDGNGGHGWPGAPAAAVCGMVLLWGVLPGRRKRRLWMLSVLLLVSIVGGGMVGCGGGSGHSTTPPPSTPSVYTMTLTAADSVNGAITGSTNFTLTVN